MKILHVASFSGNAGDNANHNGLRSQLVNHLPGGFDICELEIREFYRQYDGKNKLRFNESFAERANTFDLVIFGGGNYFEIWLEDSTTGCTIDIPPEVMKKLKCKVVFFGLGFDTYKGYSNVTSERFLNFLDRLLSSDQYLVSVRNDGSKKQLENTYGRSLSERVLKVPDGGFFCEPGERETGLIKAGRKNIVLSVAEDMLRVRVPEQGDKQARNMIIESFVSYIKGFFSDYDLNFILMPHIYSDLSIISSIICSLPDYIRRTSVTSGPYVTGNGAEAKVFSTYKQASGVLSMRFHGNVVPIGMNVPTTGISTYKKIWDLYDELGCTNRVFQVGNDNFDGLLRMHTLSMLENSGQYAIENERINKDMRIMMDRFMQLFVDFALGC